MENEAERILACQIVAKYEADHSYQPSEDERDAVAVLENVFNDKIGRAKSILSRQLYTLHPDEIPPRITNTFDAQSGYIQKRIRRHEIALLAARLNGLPNSKLDILLNRCGLRPDLVLPGIVWRCLSELFMVRVHQSLLIKAELGEFSEEQYWKYFAFDATVDLQAVELGLALVEPDRKRGQYVGPLVGMDHRAGLIKFARKGAVELPFKALAEGQRKPGLGDTVRLSFRAGKMEVIVKQH